LRDAIRLVALDGAIFGPRLFGRLILFLYCAPVGLG
jgi:hypothetical protein